MSNREGARTRVDADLLITPSLVDRLIDDDPAADADPPPPRGRAAYKKFEASVARDLEALLNSRRIPDPGAEDFQEVSTSVYYYGLPDISSLSLSSPSDRARLLRMMEVTIGRLEPRLKDVRVTLEAQPGYVRVLRFRIEGLLDMDPAPEVVSFDTELQVTSGQYEVK